MFLLVRRIRLEDTRLEPVGVLVLVDKDVVKTGLDTFGNLLVGQQVIPEQQQVIVVQDVTGMLGINIGPKEPLQLLLPLLAPREISFQCVVQRVGTVDAARVDRQAGGLAREPLVLLA